MFGNKVTVGFSFMFMVPYILVIIYIYIYTTASPTRCTRIFYVFFITKSDEMYTLMLLRKETSRSLRMALFLPKHVGTIV
jgi:hypothetical protein